jgi:hypothetical protein
VPTSPLDELEIVRTLEVGTKVMKLLEGLTLIEYTMLLEAQADTFSVNATIYRVRAESVIW